MAPSRALPKQATPELLLETLVDRLRARQLDIFCGAGVSANSGMPTARQLIESIAAALPTAGMDGSLLCIENLPFEAFLQVLSEGAPLEPLVALYRAGQPTAAHRLIARLMRQGYLRSAFTTNFDLLIERALLAEGMARSKDYRRLVNLRDFGNYPDPCGRPELVKVHGSIDHAGSVAATIRAVASRRYGREQADLLRALFGEAGKVVLVLGYSGSDKFDVMPQIATVPPPRAAIILITHIPNVDLPNAVICAGAALSDDHPWKGAGPITEVRIDTDLLLQRIALEVLGRDYGFERRATRWPRRVERWTKDLLEAGLPAAERIVGRLFEEMGDIRRSAYYYDKALAGITGDGGLAGIARLHKDRGRVANLTGDYRAAVRHGRWALSGSRRLNDLPSVAGDLGNLGLAFYNLGRTPQAIRLHRRAWRLAKRAGAEQVRANQLGNIGLAYRSAGRFRRAAACHALSVELNRKLGSVRQQAAQLANLGLCCTYLGDLAAAERFHEEGLRIFEMVGDLRRVAVQKGSLGTLRQKQRDYRGALRLFRDSLAGARRADDVRSMINQLNSISEIALEFGRPCRALIASRRALTLAEKSGHLYSMGMVNVTAGRARLALGEPGHAGRHADTALALLEQLVPPDHPYRRAAERLKRESMAP